MSKTHDQKKETKKPAAKSLKEKRAEKKAKKERKGLDSLSVISYPKRFRLTDN